MNIVVNTFDGGIACRPDTTWERENRDLYVPDFVTGYHFTPVLFARVCKAGKCIGEKFVDRYFDSIGYGMLLYPSNLLATPLWASCIDHSSFLCFPIYNKVVLDREANFFRIEADGREIFSTNEGSLATLSEAIVKASAYISLRIGDMVAVELASPAPLSANPQDLDSSRHSEHSEESFRHSEPSEASVKNLIPQTIRATFCDNTLFDFNVIK